MEQSQEEQQVFIEDKAEAWVAAVIVRRSKTEVICRANNEARIIKLKEFRKAELPYVNSVMVTDLVDMKYLHEPGVLVNLISRHEEGKPYTRSGDIIISINPFRWLHHLYSEANQKRYTEKLIWQISERDPRQDLEPHIYEVSALAYSEMAYQGRNQSIVITGESGSGKTESVKIMMHHLASIQLGLSMSTSATAGGSNTFNIVVDRILHTTPLLEAFGNALTAQNENSSRFGKHVQLQFDNTESLSELSSMHERRAAILVGSFCDIYLLEKSRVCTHATNERTYHIFYQLLAASNDQKASIWTGIVGKNASDYKYVGTPITHVIDGITDETKFSETWSAFSRIGIPTSDTIMLMQALCIVLQLGNIEFTADELSDDKAKVASIAAFSDLSELLGINTEQLLSAFTQRTITTRNETFTVPLSPLSAIEARDALAKDIYLNAFSWLSDTINTKTISTVNLTNIQNEKGIIGLLDIFGFESFETNRFEQLCINYANEKLQNKAIGDIFNAVREEYEFEGISLDLVEVVSNEQLLHLFDGRNGLLALLNEESYRPKGSSKAFTAKVIENFNASALIANPNVGIYNQFGIIHFAGKVMYTTDNFLISNQDTLPIDLRGCVSKSQNAIVAGSQKLLPFRFGESAIMDQKTMDLSETPPSTLSSGENISIGRKWELTQRKLNDKQPTAEQCKKITNPTANSWKDSHMRKHKETFKTQPKLIQRQASCSNLMAATVWVKYRAQLDLLMQTLNMTQSRYVRCIKPNVTMKPLECDRQKILKQLRYTGLVPTIVLSRAMFTKSTSNKIIRKQFGFLWDKQSYPSKAKRFDTSETRRKLDCDALLLSIMTSYEFKSDEREIQFAVGKTRSYFRRGVLEWLESTRMNELGRLATIIQSIIRGKISRNQQKRYMLAVISIQSWMATLKKNLASIVLQKICRGFLKRKELKTTTRCVLVIQKYLRRINHQVQHKAKIDKAIFIQRWYRTLKTLKHNDNFPNVVIQKHLRRINHQVQHKAKIDKVIFIQRWYRTLKIMKHSDKFPNVTRKQT